MTSQFKNKNQVIINPKKILLSKWTAIEIIEKQKHFLVSKLIQENDLTLPIIEVEIEAVYSGQKKIIPWQELKDISKWIQGWV